MKGNVWKYLLLPVLILLASYLLLFRDRDPFGGRNSNFASKPRKEITGIELSDNTGELKLTRKEDSWILDDGSEVRKSSVFFIIQILSGIEIKSPVSPELFRAEITDKGIEPVKVRIYENRKLLNSFYVYKTQSNIYGNIMKRKERSKPFIVHLPGYETNIGSVFTVNDLYWKPFTVFNLLPSEITSVKFENLVDTSSSFVIRNIDGRFVLSNRDSELSGWDTSRIIRYLSYFAYIPFESWEFEMEPSEMENLKSSDPLYIISVTSTTGGNIRLVMWERILSAGGEKKKDTDRLWAMTDSDAGIFIIRYMDIDPLLKKRSYFFP
ncbi:MAG: hypothetical protein GYA41_05650 [Bacteroidales bacterium]|nr:hypothetical protein [Bacteroidales bacterium]